ncbi:MAG: AraC family transcriptional regulator [Halioglobus sp.]
MDIVSFLAGTGILLGPIVMAGLLLRRDANQLANSLLAASLACNWGYLVLIVSLHGGLLSKYPLLVLTGYLYILSSPLLFGYIRVMTQRDFQLRWSHLIHLWPLLAISLLTLTDDGSSGFSADSLDQARGGWPPNRIALVGLFIYTVSALYFAAGLRLIRVHGKSLVDEFSYEESIALSWLKVLIALCLMSAMAGLSISLVRLLPGIELWPRSIYSTMTAIALYYLIAFFGIYQPDVFAGQRQSTQKPQTKPRYEGSGVTPELMAEHWERLEAFMTEQQPYLEHELRIASLATLVGIPTAQLSQVINQCAGKNFFDYVSSYRVQRARELLASDEASMLEIAQNSGFNSQSAFYRQFRKVTSQAPRDFRRQLVEQKSLSRDKCEDIP